MRQRILDNIFTQIHTYTYQSLLKHFAMVT